MAYMVIMESCILIIIIVCLQKKRSKAIVLGVTVSKAQEITVRCQIYLLAASVDRRYRSRCVQAGCVLSHA